VDTVAGYLRYYAKVLLACVVLEVSSVYIVY